MAMTPDEIKNIRQELDQLSATIENTRHGDISKDAYNSAISKFEDLRTKLEHTYYEKNNKYLSKDTVLGNYGVNSKAKKYSKSLGEYSHAARQMIEIIDNEVSPYSTQMYQVQQERAAAQKVIDQQNLTKEQERIIQDAIDKKLAATEAEIKQKSPEEFKAEAKSAKLDPNSNKNQANLAGIAGELAVIDPSLTSLGKAIEDQGNRLFGADYKSSETFYDQETLDQVKGIAQDAISRSNPELANKINKQVDRNKEFSDLIDSSVKDLIDKGVDYKDFGAHIERIANKTINVGADSRDAKNIYKKALSDLKTTSAEDLEELAGNTQKTRDMSAGSSAAIAADLNRRNNAISGMAGDFGDIENDVKGQVDIGAGILSNIRDGRNSAEFDLTKMAGSSSDLRDQMIYGSRFGATPLENTLKGYTDPITGSASINDKLLGLADPAGPNNKASLASADIGKYSKALGNNVDISGFSNDRGNLDRISNPSGIASNMSSFADADRTSIQGYANNVSTPQADLDALRSYGYDYGNALGKLKGLGYGNINKDNLNEREALLEGANTFATALKDTDDKFSTATGEALTYNNNLRFDARDAFEGYADSVTDPGSDITDQDTFLKDVQSEMPERYQANQADLRAIRGMSDTGFADQRTAAGATADLGYNSMNASADELNALRGRYEGISNENDPRFNEYKQAQAEELSFQKDQQIRDIKNQFASMGKAGSSQELNAIQRLNDQFSRQSRQLTSELGMQQLSRQDSALGTMGSLTNQGAALKAQGVGFYNQRDQLNASLLDSQLSNATAIQDRIGSSVSDELAARTNIAGSRASLANMGANASNAALGMKADLTGRAVDYASQLTDKDLAYNRSLRDVEADALTTGFNAKNATGFNALSTLGNQVDREAGLLGARAAAYSDPIKTTSALRTSGGTAAANILASGASTGQEGLGNAANAIASAAGASSNIRSAANATAFDLANTRANLRGTQLDMENADRAMNSDIYNAALSNRRGIFSDTMSGQGDINNVYNAAVNDDIARRSALAASAAKEGYDELDASNNIFNMGMANRASITSNKANLLNTSLANADRINNSDLAFRYGADMDLLNRKASIADTSYGRSRDILDAGYGADQTDISNSMNILGTRADMFSNASNVNRNAALDDLNARTNAVGIADSYMGSSTDRANALNFNSYAAPLNLVNLAGSSIAPFNSSVNAAKTLELDAFMAGINMLTTPAEMKFAKNALP